MGLDAFVSCNCYKEGKTSPFPLPELEQYFGLFDGGWHLKMPNRDYRIEIDLEIDRWMLDDACEHEFMKIASEHLANWSGYRAFQQALSEIGWHHFPVLHAELPNANWGTMPARSSALVLRELDYFQHETHFETKFSLFDTETGEVIHDYIKSYRGMFIGTGNSEINIGIDPDGFFIQTGDDPPVILFRSKRFEQRPLNTIGDDPQSAVVEFYDADTEARYKSTTNVTRCLRWPDGRWENDGRKLNLVVPRLMHVAERTVGAEEYDYIVQPLIRLCKASVEKGNPVVWT